MNKGKTHSLKPDQERILAVEERWVAAHRSLDLRSIDAILSDDFRQILPDGSVVGKEELLASYRSGSRRWEIARSDELEVHIRGEIAWVIGRWRGKGENNGVAFDYQARFLAIYGLEAGEWKLTAELSNPIERTA